MGQQEAVESRSGSLSHIFSSEAAAEFNEFNSTIMPQQVNALQCNTAITDKTAPSC